MHKRLPYLQFFYSMIPALVLLFAVFYFSSPTAVNNKQMSYSKRYPANSSETCRNLIRSLIGTESAPLKAWKKLTDIPNNYRFDFEKFKLMKDKYILDLETISIKELDFQKTPESIMALAEALNKEVGSDLENGLAKMSFIKRRKLERLVQNIEKVNSPSINQVEELVANVYATVLGPKFKLSYLMESHTAKNKIMSRIVQEEILKDGLIKVLSKNSELRATQGFFKKFINSYKGKYLATMLFNLPVLAGFPPLYLPGLKKIKLPPELARELLEKGLTEEMLQKLNVEVLQDLSVNLTHRNGYEIFRRYYMAGISVYLTYVMLEEFYEGEKIREENILLEEIASDMDEILEQAEILQSRGIDIFNESEADVLVDLGQRTEFETLDNPFCRAIKECLQMHKDETGEEAVKGSNPYKECKSFMDPENKCHDL